MAPVQPPLGLFASPIWQVGQDQTEFNVVVYNSLTIDPQGESNSHYSQDQADTRLA